jgi:hypothetical protein
MNGRRFAIGAAAGLAALTVGAGIASAQSDDGGTDDTVVEQPSTTDDTTAPDDSTTDDTTAPDDSTTDDNGEGCHEGRGGAPREGAPEQSAPDQGGSTVPGDSSS